MWISQSSTASLVLFLLQAISCFGTFDGNSLDGNLEESVEASPCVRLFTNQGDIGCRTPNGKAVGALYEIRSVQDIYDIDKIEVDFAILTPAKYFDATLISALAEKKPEGVIIYDDEWIPSDSSEGKYSTELNTTQGIGSDQEQYTYNSAYAWNNYGNGIMYKSLPYAVVLAEDGEVSNLLNLCKENRKFGLPANRMNVAEFKYYMGQSGVTSKECLAWTDTFGQRSPQCLPIGGLSVWSSAGVLDDRDKVLVTAAVDSAAFFHYKAFGANDAVASITVLLAAAESIGRSGKTANLTKQPLFFLANAEEMGYAGSRRFARDITSGINCAGQVPYSDTSSGLPLCTDPIYPSTLFDRIKETTITDAVGVDQVGRLANGQLYLHSLQGEPYNMQTFADVSEGMDGVSVSASSVLNTIPPTPLSSFMKAIPDLEQTGVILSGYDAKFNDPTYHSRFDTVVSLDDIISTAGVLARSVFVISGGDADDIPAINVSFTGDLLDCLLTDWLCPLMSRYASAELRNMADYLGGDVSMRRGTVPPIYYTGVLEPSSGGLPVVQHGAYVYGRYEMNEDVTWDKDHDKIYNVPSVLEAFIRTFLSYHLGGNGVPPEDGGVDLAACTVSSECGKCTILDYVDSVQMECIDDKCICPSASYHLALDPGVAAETNPYYYEVIDDDAVAYTEPYWRSIGLTVYTSAGNGISVAALVVGLTVFVLSVAGVLTAQEYMVKLKVF